jgi:hypothetical protein
VALNKIDALTEDEIKAKREALKKAARKAPLLLSGVAGTGVTEALARADEADPRAPPGRGRGGQGRVRRRGKGIRGAPREGKLAAMTAAAQRVDASPLLAARRVVVKIGSALLVDETKGEVRRDWLEALTDDVARLHKGGCEVVLVSSGAIALGRTHLKLASGPLRLEESQAAAATGRSACARRYQEALARHGITVAQILLTLTIRRSAAATSTRARRMATLLGLGAMPVINENDTVATDEIRFGDNDRLARAWRRW